MESSNRSEIIGGITSFLATFYIILVNPAILQNAGMPFNALITSTILVCFLSTLLMGTYAKNPIVVAPGMGLNAFFAFSVVIGGGHTWQQALGAVFWSGIVFLILSTFKGREYILNAIPKQ